MVGALMLLFLLVAMLTPGINWVARSRNVNPLDEDKCGATFGSTRLARTDERLTIDQGNDRDLRLNMVITLILVAAVGAVLIRAAVLISATVANELGTLYVNLTVAGAILLLLGQRRNRIVIDRVQCRVRLVRISLFRTFVRREVPFVSVRRARITGVQRASWRFAIELGSGELWMPLFSLRTEAYQPDELQKFADQVNKFLGAAKTVDAKA
jgi:hypothetical protein